MPHALIRSASQIPWGEEFDHECARELFGSNLLVLTWIKGETMPGELVDEILRGLGLERETDEQRRGRLSFRDQGSSARGAPTLHRLAGAASYRGRAPRLAASPPPVFLLV